MTKQIPVISDTIVGIGGKMYRIASATAMKSSARKNDDAIAIKVSDDAVGILVADGATGIGQGHIASAAVKTFFEDKYDLAYRSPIASGFLTFAEGYVREVLKTEQAEADTTAIALTIRGGWIDGASRGDSDAYLFGPATHHLTQAQVKRPRLGNSDGKAVAFNSAFQIGDILVVATDGLWNRLSCETIEDVAKRSLGVDQTVATLLSLARTCDGKYDDDVSIVAVARLR